MPTGTQQATTPGRWRVPLGDLLSAAAAASAFALWMVTLYLLGG